MPRDSIRGTAAYKLLSGRPIAYYAEVARAVGGVLPGVLMCQAVYWDSLSEDEDRWFYKSRAEWYQETALSRFEQESAVRSLKAKGLLETRQSMGTTRTLEYRVNAEALLELLENWDKQPGSPCATSPRMETRPNSASKRGVAAHGTATSPRLYIEQRLLPKTTSETTSETTFPPTADSTQHSTANSDTEFPDESSTGDVQLGAEPPRTVTNTVPAPPPAPLPGDFSRLDALLAGESVPPREPVADPPAPPPVPPPPKKAATKPNASKEGYELLQWWCQQTNSVLKGDINRRHALGMDELLRKAGSASESQEYIRYRIDKGWQVSPKFLAEGYVPTWRRNAKPKSLADDRPFEEKMAEMDRKIAIAEERERAEAAGEIEPRKEKSLYELFDE